MNTESTPPPPFRGFPAAVRARHRLLFGLAVVAVASLGIVLFADFLWRTDLYGLKWALLVVYAILFTHLSFGFCTALFGFGALRFGAHPATRLAEDLPAEGAISEGASTAILVPIYNEDVTAVFGNLRATYRSLEEAGVLEHFDFFVLSDTRDPEVWLEEEAAWKELCRELSAFDRIHYRHRRDNARKKAGNISHFLEAWGAQYRYMIIFDADSLMLGSTLASLVRTMEANPQVGILQTVPGLYRGETLYARLQQFANRLYGRVYLAGLHYWQLSEGNYWGHNAIIRVQPFIEACELPRLPGREPLGGAILSHDFVEAALMRRAGFEVWLAPGLEGSYEEGPPQLEESLQRDRRWCQGNLQHSWLLFSRDFTFPNRLHFLNGIMAYVGSLTWFVFLFLSTLVVVSFARTNLSLFATTGFTRWLELSLLEHGLVLLGVTAVILYGPKLLSIIDLALTPGRRRDFGGWWRASGSAVLETLSSALLAPLLMIWHTIHIVSIFFGARVSWGGADRAGGGVQWGALLLRHGPLALLGAAWLVVAWSFEPTFAAWLAPVAGPLALAPLLVGIFSSRRLGRWLRRRGWLLTPEEVVPPSAVGELVADRAAVAKRLPAGPPWVARAVADPFLNALHVALEQRQAETFELEMTDEEKTLLEKVLRDGLEGLGAEERRRFLHAPRAVDAAYQGIWTRAPAQLAAEWAAVMSAFRP